MKKIKVATCSLAGCFGCHMSLLDIDERIIALVDKVEFDRSPITDIKHCGKCDVGLIEGGACNEENVHVLREFRENCSILVAVGACAITGGIPAVRNHFRLEDCLDEAFPQSGVVPKDVELPKLLDKVYPVHEVVKIDHFLPGCPPSADAFWFFLTELIQGRTPVLPKELRHYD